MLGVSRVTLYKKMKAYKLLKERDEAAQFPLSEFAPRAAGG
jgi:hypothetical protein